MQGKLSPSGHLDNGYVPHPAALRIHQSSARFRVCACGRRFGKTTLALQEAFKAAWENQDPLARVWYIANSYDQAKGVAWDMLKERVIPEQLIASINEAELSIRLVNRSLIELKGADSPNSLRGRQLKFAVLDEIGTMRPNVWDEIIRPSLADTKGSRAIFIGTPSGFNHFKVLFDRGAAGKEKEWASFKFRTLDNPIIDPKEIDEIRLRTPPAIYRQEYEASFEQMAGSIYPMFKRATHVVPPTEIKDHWDRVVGLDWGMNNPTAVVFAAIDENKTIWVYDVLYESGKTVSQWAEILRMRADFEQINSWIIDPSALAQAREFGNYGIFFHSYNPDTTQRLNDVNIGINLVSQVMLEGRVKIFEHCETLIQQLEQYQWDPSQGKLGQDPRSKPFKKDDHSCDALRYLVMGKFEAKVPKENKYKHMDGATKQFWMAHNNELPEFVKPKGNIDPYLGGMSYNESQDILKGIY